MERGLIGSIFSLCIVIIITGSDAEFWNDLRVHFNLFYPNGGGFDRLPRTARDAAASSWVSDSLNCTNGGKFNGYRYTDSTDPNAEFAALLFDVQGVISGVQIYIPQAELLFNEDILMDEIPMYQKDSIGGVDYYVSTAYFVDPDSICDGGRPESDLETEGTGNSVQFQNGPTPDDLVEIPLTREESLEQGDWGKNGCVTMMGFHGYYREREWDRENCAKIGPAFGIYNNDGNLIAFGFNIPVKLSSPKFETIITAEILHATEGEDKFPPCLFEANEKYGITTLHFYFQDEPWKNRCPGEA